MLHTDGWFQGLPALDRLVCIIMQVTNTQAYSLKQKDRLSRSIGYFYPSLILEIKAKTLLTGSPH